MKKLIASVAQITCIDGKVDKNLALKGCEIIRIIELHDYLRNSYSLLLRESKFSH